MSSVLVRTGKKAKSQHIAGRLDEVAGKTVAAATPSMIWLAGLSKIVTEPAKDKSSQEELGDRRKFTVKLLFRRWLLVVIC